MATGVEQIRIDIGITTDDVNQFKLKASAVAHGNVQFQVDGLAAVVNIAPDDFGAVPGADVQHGRIIANRLVDIFDDDAQLSHGRQIQLLDGRSIDFFHE